MKLLNRGRLFANSLSYAIHELAGVVEKRNFQETKKSGKDELFSESEKERKYRQIKLWVDKVFRRWDLNQDGQVMQSHYLCRNLALISKCGSMS